MGIYLDVPFVSQLGFGNKSDPQDDPTGCWYCSSCMVGYYFEAGPRMGVPELHTLVVGTFKDGKPMIGHHVIDDYHTPLFLARENLVAVTEPTQWTIKNLEEILRKWGPQVISWTKTHGGNSYGHCSVLIGVDDAKSEVIIHDPENAPNSRMSIADFNAAFMFGFGWGMLRKDVPSHTPKSAPAP
jgi:hypothetical protein